MPLPARAAAIVSVLDLGDMSLTRRWDGVLSAACLGVHAARVNLRFSVGEVRCARYYIVRTGCDSRKGPRGLGDGGFRWAGRSLLIPSVAYYGCR